MSPPTSPRIQNLICPLRMVFLTIALFLLHKIEVDEFTMNSDKLHPTYNKLYKILKKRIGKMGRTSSWKKKKLQERNNEGQTVKENCSYSNSRILPRKTNKFTYATHKKWRHWNCNTYWFYRSWDMKEQWVHGEILWVGKTHFATCMLHVFDSNQQSATIYCICCR